METKEVRSNLDFYCYRYLLPIIGTIAVVLIFGSTIAAQEHDPGVSLERSRNVRFQKVTWKEVASFNFDSSADITDCDATGNSTSASGDVTVPHDKGKGKGKRR